LRGLWQNGGIGENWLRGKWQCRGDFSKKRKMARGENGEGKMARGKWRGKNGEGKMARGNGEGKLAYGLTALPSVVFNQLIVKNCQLKSVEILTKLHPLLVLNISMISFEPRNKKSVALPGPLIYFTKLNKLVFSNVSKIGFSDSSEKIEYSIHRRPKTTTKRPAIYLKKWTNSSNNLSLEITNSATMSIFPEFSPHFADKVTSLRINNWKHLTNLSNIGTLTNLETLFLNNNYNLKSLDGNVFEKNSKLECLDVQNNAIEDLKSDTLKGLDSLEIIKLGGNKFKSVPERFFANAPNIKVIDWTSDKCQNKSGIGIIRTFPDSMLTAVNDKLERFNFQLADPDCKLIIKPDSFSQMQFKTLKHLSVTNTHLTYNQLISGFVRKFKNLKTLNIEENNIEELNSKVFKHFKSLKLKVGQNPYKCHCMTLNTLQNLRHNITDFANIKCFPTLDQLLTIDEALHVISCPSMDVPTNVTNVTALTLGTIVVILIILILLYKLRITCYNHRLLHKLFPGEPMVDNNDLKYDAFISYSEKDVNIATCIYRLLNEGTHGRRYDTAIDEVTWEPGTLKATNIEDSIRMSRRTIAIVSEDYLNDDYCLQAFEVARRHPSRYI
jgi:hypothetical protein